jgi:hypothetical protein
LIDTLQRLLSVPNVDGVAFFAPDGESYSARLNDGTEELPQVAETARAWFAGVGSEVRFLEVRAAERKMLWFRAGRGTLLVTAKPSAHTPPLASRIALSIVSLVDSVVASQKPAAAKGETNAPLGTPTIPAPVSTKNPLPPSALAPVVTFIGTEPNEPQRSAQLGDHGALDEERLLRSLVDVLNALSRAAERSLGGPVRRNYLNRARKAVSSGGGLEAFELELDGSVRLARAPDIDPMTLAKLTRGWCERFVEHVSVLEPAFAATPLEELCPEHAQVLASAGFKKADSSVKSQEVVQ